MGAGERRNPGVQGGVVHSRCPVKASKSHCSTNGPLYSLHYHPLPRLEEKTPARNHARARTHMQNHAGASACTPEQ